MIDFARFHFHSVIALPREYEVYDFTRGYDPNRDLQHAFGIGRYDEDRRGMYDAALFQNGEAPRTIHMGIDIGAPVGTPVHAFYDGEIFLLAYNGAEGDYGHTVITRHVLGGEELFALHGHLSERSTRERAVGARFQAGDVIAWVGDRHENGGWNPHLHFQLCVERPEVCDMPGVVSPAQRAEALKRYPDPRLVLGKLY
jgi:murein DD-endopeptidase MepM/ murein hydrolase activator NlpD